MKNTLKLYASELLYKLNFPIAESDDILRAIKEEGCYKIDSFIDKETCQELCAEADKVFENQPEIVRFESNGADARIYGIDRHSRAFDLEKVDDLSNAIFKKFSFYLKHDGFKLLGRIKADENNLGSGGGWHRDAPFMHQFKNHSIPH